MATIALEEKVSAATMGLGETPDVFPPDARSYAGRVLFSAELPAALVAQDADIVNCRTFANLRDVSLNRLLLFTANDPQLVAKIYAFRVSVARGTGAVAPPDEQTQRLIAENVVLSTGPIGQPKFSMPGLDVGSAFPSKSAATTAAATTVDNVGRVARRSPILGGDYVDFTGDLITLRAGFAFTPTVATRVILELWGVFARRGTVDNDWRRQPCPPELAAQLRGQFKSAQGFLQL
jgi:hypothetical protein